MQAPTTVSSVLNSAKFIAAHAQHVKISQSGVTKAAREVGQTRTMKELFCAMGSEGVGNGSVVVDPLEPPGLSEKEILEWLFLLDTLNFCFWSDESTLFTVRYKNRLWTGYRSLCAALARAKEAGLPIHAPSFYGTITMDKLNEVFRSETNISIPLLEKRRENLHEVAAVLNKKYGGQVSNLIRQCNKSAQKLVQLLATHFPCYCDVSTYNGQTVSFLKRAQIFVADVWMRFGGRGYGEFHDIDALTMFADYRVPQDLLYLDVLQYSDELMGRLVRGEHVEVGSSEEVEIRGCSIWAVELLKQQMLALWSQESTTTLSPASEQNGGTLPPSSSINSVTIDFYLWNYAKQHSNLMAHLPIHRTLTIFY